MDMAKLLVLIGALAIMVTVTSPLTAKDCCLTCLGNPPLRVCVVPGCDPNDICLVLPPERFMRLP